MTEIKEMTEKFPVVLVKQQVVGDHPLGWSVDCSECGKVVLVMEFENQAIQLKNYHEAMHFRNAGKPTHIMQSLVSLSDAQLMAWIDNRRTASEERHQHDEGDIEACHLQFHEHSGYIEALDDLTSYIKSLRSQA